MPNRYETVFILTPVLSEEQARETVRKFRKILTDLGANIIQEESWGLPKTGDARPRKSTGYYQLFEFETASHNVVADLELAYKRDERVLRFLTIRLDKYTLRGTAQARLFEGLEEQGSESEGVQQT